MKKQTFIFVWLSLSILLRFLPPSSWAAESKLWERSNDPVQVTIASSTDQLTLEKPFWLAIKFKIQPGWQLYAPNNSEMGEPIQIQWSTPTAIKILEVLWPTPTHKERDSVESYIYEDEIWVLAKAVLEKPVSKENLKVSASVTWVACNYVCKPGKAELTLDLNQPSSLISPDQLIFWLEKIDNQEEPLQSDDWLIPLLLAILGGILLNFMPCVLPVLSLKIMDLLKPQNEKHSLTVHGLAFTSGVVLSFLSLGAILLSLRAGGQELGWGFQLQSSLFVTALAGLFWLIALNMWGVFEIGLVFTRIQLTQSHHLLSTFANGVLASVLASPCTAPFMGTALGFALTQSWAVGLLIFGGLGVGMALPFLLICLCPPLVKILPKPGAWMESLKHFLGFALAATVLWLLWIIGHQQGLNTLLEVMTGLLMISMGAWIWGRWAIPYHSLKVRLIARLIGIAFMASALGVIAVSLNHVASSVETKIDWQAYTPERLQQALDQGQPVIIDFTAAWCVTCQVNKKMVLEKPVVIKAIKELNILPLRADWTQHDSSITQALAEYGRTSIPLVVLYGKSKKPVLMPALLTTDNLLKNLEELKRG